MVCPPRLSWCNCWVNWMPRWPTLPISATKLAGCDPTGSIGPARSAKPMIPVRMLSKSWAIRPAMTAASASRWASRSGSTVAPVAAATTGALSITRAVRVRYARSFSVHGCPAGRSAQTSPLGRPGGVTAA